MQGWISLHRKLFDNPIMGKPNYLSVWIYLLLRANHKETQIIWNNERITIKKGQFVGSIKQIADYYGLSKATVSYILEYLERENMIIKKSNKKFTLFEIKNYDKYQKVERQVERVVSSEPLDNKGLDSGQDKILNGKLFSKLPQVETNNKDNNDNKKDIVQIEFEKFWNYYDKKTSKKKCEAKWKQISTADKDVMRGHLPKYIESTPDKKYRKNPLTYLNSESWNDEIIISQKAEDIQSQISLVNQIGVQ